MKTKRFLCIDNIIFLGIFSLCIIVISLRTSRETLIFSQIIRAMQRVQQIFGMSLVNLKKNLKDFSTLLSTQEQNKILTQKMEFSIGLERQLQNLQNENDYLRNQLGIASKLHYQVVHAEVLARDFNSFVSTVILSKGSLDGIKKGMIVVAHNLQQELYGLVGRIVEVSPRGSHVRLAFHDQFYIVAKIEKNNITGLFHGGGAPGRYGNLEYISVNNSPELNVDDLVITSGIDDVTLSQKEREILYPKGIYLGRIRKIDSTSYQASLNIEINPAVNFAKFEHALIITHTSRKMDGKFL